MLEKLLLAPYYLTLKVRHALYDSGVWKSYKSDVPTICVGNITAGGTGKTPHTEMILKTLLASEDWSDKNIAVLSRGHKRKSFGFQQVPINGSASFYGDEPVQIKKKYPEVTVAVDRPRIEGCDFLAHPEKLQVKNKRTKRCKDNNFPPSDLIVLDDAFQYRTLKADFNIILVDYNRPVYKDKLLPFGRLRDLPERLHDADIILVTKCPAYMEDWERTKMIRSMHFSDFDPETCTAVDKKGKKITILFTTINYIEPTPVFPDTADKRYIYSKYVILFTGIAKDTPLRRYLSDKYRIVKRFGFADHHKYSGSDMKHILQATQSWPTAVVATTEKDSQRVRDYKRVPEALKERMFQVPIEVYFLSDNEKEIFEKTLGDALRHFLKN